MKKWKIALAAACVFVLVTVAYAANAAAAAGSQNDPLVTLSYLQNIFWPKVEEMAQDAVESHQAELEQALNDIIDSRTPTESNPGTGGSASFEVITLSQGQTLTGDVGCEIMLRVGTAKCVSDSAPGLIDTTSGGTLNNGGALVTNHLYMVTISTRSVTATSGTVKLLVRGPYTIS